MATGFAPTARPDRSSASQTTHETSRIPILLKFACRQRRRLVVVSSVRPRPTPAPWQCRGLAFRDSRLASEQNGLLTAAEVGARQQRRGHDPAAWIWHRRPSRRGRSDRPDERRTSESPKVRKSESRARKRTDQRGVGVDTIETVDAASTPRRADRLRRSGRRRPTDEVRAAHDAGRRPVPMAAARREQIAYPVPG